LTTAALDREVARLEKRMDDRVAWLREWVDAEQRCRDERAAGLRDWAVSEHASRSQIVNLQFELIERQRVELKADQAKSLEFALTQSGGELDNLAHTYETGHASLVSAIDELKGRVTTVEAKAVGGRQVSDSVYVIIGLLISLALLAATTVHLWAH
jgi:hypothetical protein